MAGIDYSPHTYTINRTADGAMEPTTNPEGGGFYVEHNGQEVVLTDALIVHLCKLIPQHKMDTVQAWQE